ncbi:PREDICTED: heavy metal-associated isoprenylated plant protein 4 isoform X2 [Nicotiana attenuata]|uniref:heavy metal-associated isoprenylated plant protein 4 isoform X2 n=1 Tax=Nicotiana attenuata TaxID=49451 RepID=UPI000904F536|nr:PREDICTED: heavy metal-associated isoprenylated plant protein 4 isoform X2 [Nicotiana attenuata]
MSKIVYLFQVQNMVLDLPKRANTSATLFAKACIYATREANDFSLAMANDFYGKHFMESIKTSTLKVYMHCNKCELDLKKRLLKHKGIHNVKTDFKAQTLTVETVLESEKVVTYVRKNFRKHVEIIKKKEEEKKEKVTVEVKTTEKIVELNEVKKVEAKNKEGEVSYFVHYVYAPQWFSDENPNACSVM